MKPLAALVLILVAVGSLFFVLTQTDNDSGSNESDAIEQDTPRETSDAPANAPGTLANAGSNSREVAAVPTASQARTEAVTTPEDEFNNRVTGVVLSTTMEPIEGAKVTLTRHGLAGMLFVNGAVDRSKDRHTTTDSEGKYGFAKIEPYDGYSLEANADGYSRGEVPNISVPAEGPLDAPPILLSIGASLSGTITDSGGNPVPEAKLQLDGLFTANDGVPGVDALFATTDNLGKYLITNVPVGNRKLTIKAEGYANNSRGGLVFRGEEPLTMDLSLEIAEMICGRVISKSGQAIPGAHVVGSNYSNSNRQCRDETTTDANGEFCLQNVASGQYTVQVNAPGYRTTSEPRVKTGGQSLIIEMVKQGVVKGRLVAADGPLPTPYRVQLRQVHGANPVTSAVGAPVVYNTGDGEFSIECAQAGTYKIEGSAPGYAPTYSDEFSFTGAQPMTGVIVRMKVGGSITGSVVDATGNPVPKPRVTTHSNDWTNSLFDRALGDQFPTNITSTAVTGKGNGKFTIPNLNPETYQLRVRAPGFCEATVQDILVVDGKATPTATIQLIRGGEISGTVIDTAGRPVINANVRLAPEMGSNTSLPRNYEIRAGADGSYTIRNIFPGKYKLSATLNNEASIFMGGLSIQGQNVQTISVQDGQSQTYELTVNS